MNFSQICNLTFFRILLLLCLFGTLYLILQSEAGFLPKLQVGSRKLQTNDIKEIPGKGKAVGVREDENPSGSRFLSFCFEEADFSKSCSYRNVSSPDNIEIAMILTKAHEIRGLKEKFSVSVSSIFQHTNSTLRFHLICDDHSMIIARKVIQSIGSLANNFVQIFFYHVDYVIKPVEDVISYLQPHFTYKPGAYYSDSLFFLSIVIYRVFPQERLLMIDVDTKFMSDVSDLYSHFKNFTSQTVIGLAYEQQPVYHHLLHEYHQAQPDSLAGMPQPAGSPGFNSGVLLLELQSMRNSNLYQNLIQETAVKKLVQKYKFKGHLGDQDLYSLLGFEHKELFHILPCTWNRQLCHWWKDHGYEDVFEDYNQCDGEINLYHGNCNTQIPD
ncbi:xyloside xylosyltransferase 1-like [Limulus polyphemus]|uniref:Xyloside xylosyltransferase 1-like n=1 Tax=Limulus polyphemus TaxID=6850 RepID=A0ABM1AZZ8_LIMPO|nr:xyloside xylosyltransferase 1-like [Limulus polyphemus]